jgi:hypothetical protein
MSLNRNLATRVALAMLLFAIFTAIFASTANAQTTADYWVTVNPAASSTVLYGSVGKNWTIPFQVVWSYGDNSGEAIKNSNVTVEVKTASGASVTNITQETNAAGDATFYYASSTPVVLTFTPTKLTTEDGVEWNSTLHETGQTAVYGFQSQPVTVYWDTYAASLVSTETDKQGVTEVSVNVTYLMVPEGGLVSPNSSSSPQIFHPKIAHDVNVTINGVQAEETSVEGVYAASFSTWLPTGYVMVDVSQSGWSTAQVGFSFAHAGNASVWTIAVVLGVVCAAVVSGGYFALSRKSKGAASLDRRSYPFIGGVLLAGASLVSLYWGLVGLDSTASGFDWMLLGVCGLISCGFGFAGSVMAIMRKKQTLAIFSVCAPLLTNAIAVMASFDVYMFATPWLIVVPSLALSLLSGFLICNQDGSFS